MKRLGGNKCKALVLCSSLLLALSSGSCQAPIRNSEPVAAGATNRESGVSFVARRTGPEIRFECVPGDANEGVLMVGREGAVHLFCAIPGDGLRYWRYEGGNWVSLGQVAELEWDRVPWYGRDRIDVVQTLDGRLYLFLMDHVLSQVGEGWEPVHTLNDLYYPVLAEVRAVVGPDGMVHVLYSGNLGERYMHVPDSSTASKIFHAALSEGGWTRGQPIMGRGRYDPREFEVAAGPAGSLYVAFRMERVPPFLGHPPGWKYQPPDLALSVFEDGKWQLPVILMRAPEEEPAPVDIQVRHPGRPTANDTLELLRAAQEGEHIRVNIHAGPFGWPGAHDIAVDSTGTCHLVFSNKYFEYREGKCTAPYVFWPDARGSTIFVDEQDRVIIFFLSGGELQARIRDGRGWSATFKVADSTAAGPLRGFDGHMYLLWTEGRQPADLCLQRVVFNESDAAREPVR